MADVVRAKTSPTGYIARIAQVTTSGNTMAEYPVARFDDEGYALIADPAKGTLVRAAEFRGYLAVLPMWQVAR